MEYALTGNQMKKLDQYAIHQIGIPSLVFMENAAREAAEVIERREKVRKILVVSGTGNNGADGLCLFRILRIHGFSCDCVVVGEEEKGTEEFCAQKRILENLSFELLKECDCKRYDVIVDALFGVGLTREVTGVFAEIIREINASGAYIYGMDMPSGISSENGKICGCAVKADCTITFGCRKIGTIRYPGREYCGKLIIKDIGYPDAICELLDFQNKYCTDDDLQKIQNRSADGNKGTFGKVLIIAGSEKYCGAAVLACKAAYRMGAGMVKAVTHRENKNAFCSAVPEALSLLYGEGEPETDFRNELESSLQWADVAAVGPGLSKSRHALELLEFVLEHHEGKKVILDADALNLLAEEDSLKAKLGKNMILTPHPVEMARLAGKDVREIKEKPEDTAKEFAIKYGCNVVLKDAVTISTDGCKVFYNLSGNSGMATAGSGDVLTGILAAAGAWKLPMEDIMALAVYIHGKAGDMAAEKYGQHGMTASDIIEGLSFLGKKQSDGTDRGKD